MAEYSAIRSGRDFFLANVNDSSKKLIQITPEIAKLIYNGYIIVVDNVFFNSNGYVLTVMGQVSYADDLSHLQSLLSEKGLQLAGYLPACDDVR